jgi:hypothetical protein
MSNFLPAYNARFSFFSSPFSAKWKENAKMEDVLKHTLFYPESRTAEVICERGKQREPNLILPPSLG